MKSKRLVRFLIILLSIISLIFFSIFSYFKLKEDSISSLTELFGISDVISYSESGKEKLLKAKELVLNGQYEESSFVLAESKQDFDKAILVIEEADMLYSRYLPVSPAYSGINALQAASEASQASIYLNNLLWSLTTEFNFGKVILGLENLAISMGKIEESLSKVNLLFLPEDLKNKIVEIKYQLDSLLWIREIFLKHIDSIYDFFGMNEAKTYAVVLQNSAEGRATGGFIGSLVLFTMQGGILIDWKIIDTHLLDFQGGSYSPAPEYMHYIDRIALQEANYSPDVRLSGERIRYFLEEQGGPTVNGIFFIDDKILPLLLDYVGDVSVDGFDINLNSKNYFDFIQLNLEKINVNREKRVENPKAVFFDIVKEIQQKVIKKRPTYVELKVFKEMIEQKHIQVYFKDEDLEELFDELGFLGYFPSTEKKEDFLFVVHSTFFNKSNRYMEDSITHISNVYNDGKIIDSVKIDRKHNYENIYLNELMRSLNITFDDISKKNEMIDILGRGDNNSLVRVYVPKGSKVLSVKNIKKEDLFIGNELDKTFFAFPMEIGAYESKDITIEYELPFKLDDIDEYSMIVMKQPGVDNLFYTKKLVLYDGEENISLDSEIYDYLKFDTIISSYYSNKYLWNKTQLQMEKTKIKSISKLKMSIDQEFMPMLLR